MIKPIKNVVPYEPDNGDVNIFGAASYILPATELQEDDHYLSLDYFSLSPWDAVWKANIDMIALVKAGQELCPITGLMWNGWIPVGILAKDVSVYTGNIPAHTRQMAVDKNWNARYFPDLDTMDDLPTIQEIMLGTGFSLGIMPYDGSGELKWFTIKLDNGDMLLGAGHVWYNK